MPLTVKVKDATTGKMVDGQVIEMVEVSEPTTRIVLEDGTEVLLRTNVSRVVRLLDKWDENGAPIYSVEATGALTVNVHADLYRESSDDE